VTVLLILLPPTLTALAFLLSFDRVVPAIFRQPQDGENGRDLEMNSFRAMKVDTTFLRHEVVVETEDMQILHTHKNDPPDHHKFGCGWFAPISEPYAHNARHAVST
jgi:lipopolysaccharide/colanic/teichoic acid biosynthesis glycosyltransferase